MPIGLVTLAAITGESFETIFWIGLASFIVAMMFRRSLPRTPFD